MVKINFEDIGIYTDIERKTMVRLDMKKKIANDLYNRGQGIAFHALALKIYNSQGEIELSEEEYNLLMDYVRQMGTPAAIDALESYNNK
jgi:hypothetical protein